jgi:dTDP-4-amino-4,6-dideoxygalactose transaminase
MNERIYLSPPHMEGGERELLLDAFDSNWIAPLGPHVDQFEQEFAAKVGVAHAVALASGTAALHLALILAGVKRGDCVWTNSLTFAATANAITYVGAVPVFIDSDVHSWTMDLDLLEAALEKANANGSLPAALLPVDIYGHCPDYKRLMSLARQYGVFVIEDAAESLGSHWNGQPAGSFADIGAFSFNGNKIITASAGGMLVTNDEAVASRVRYLATQARDPAPWYEHSVVGYNYRLSNLLAALGRGQLRHLEGKVRRCREIRKTYMAALNGRSGLRFLTDTVDQQSNAWLTVLLCESNEQRERIRLSLEAQNIESRPAWKPMHLQPVFADCQSIGGAVSERLFQTGLCLPSGSSLSPADQERVLEAIQRCIS